MIEKKVNKFVTSKFKNLNIEVKDKIYFCNRMTEYYDKEEKKLKEIIYNHAHSVSDNSKVHLNVYNRNSMIMNEMNFTKFISIMDDDW